MDDQNDRTEKMRAIRDEVMNLTSLPLYSYRTENNYFPVIGEGSHHASLTFVGEAPGKNEAKTGRPFCGAAGKILDELIGSIGLKREDVYITNIVKDRPPENRDPTEEEIAAYAPFLDRQINIIQPKIIAGLGRYSSNYLLEKFEMWEEIQPISKMHGRVIEVKAEYGSVKIVPLYHPAASIYNRTTLDDLKKDFQTLKKVLTSV